MIKEIQEKLKKIKMFQAVNDKEIQEILNISTVKKLSRDNVLFYEGEMPQYFYVLLQGSVKFYRHNFKGTELVFHYFTKPTLMAEMPSLENIPFRASAVALKDETEVLLIDRDKFITLIHENRELSFCVIKSLNQKIKELDVNIKRNLIYDATTKVCSFILENPTELIGHKHKETATLLNMAPETLSRVLKKLKKMNILNKECQLIDHDKMEMFLDF